VALKARSIAGRIITSWTLSASNNGTVFDILLTSTSYQQQVPPDLSASNNGTVFDTLLTSTSALTKPSLFEIDSPASYQYYKFSILASEGITGVGVQYMQLHT